MSNLSYRVLQWLKVNHQLQMPVANQEACSVLEKVSRMWDANPSVLKVGRWNVLLEMNDHRIGKRSDSNTDLLTSEA